jgi:hypothetical protein
MVTHSADEIQELQIDHGPNLQHLDETCRHTSAARGVACSDQQCLQTVLPYSSDDVS